MKKEKLTGWPPRVIAQLPYPNDDTPKPDPFAYILHLAQEEADAGHAGNAARLRAVPGVVEALEYAVNWAEGYAAANGNTPAFLSDARAALAPFAEVKP